MATTKPNASKSGNSLATLRCVNFSTRLFGQQVGKKKRTKTRQIKQEERKQKSDAKPNQNRQQNGRQ